MLKISLYYLKEKKSCKKVENDKICLHFISVNKWTNQKRKNEIPWVLFHIQMPSYQYSISNHENKTVTWPSYTYNENLYTQKDMLVFVMKLCLAGFFQIMVQIMYGFHNREQWHTLSDVANMLSRIDKLNATTSIVLYSTYSLILISFGQLFPQYS